MDTEIETHTIAGHQFDLPKLPTEHLAGASYLAHVKLAASIDEAYTLGKTVTSNSHLSDEGKHAQLAPIGEKAWGTLLQAREELDYEAARLDARQAELEAVPPVANPTQQGIDAEARSWWRGLPNEERLALMQSLADEGETGHNTFTKYNDLWQALLRSPIPLPDHEVEFVGDIWKRIRRLDNPVEFSRIQTERNALEWAEQALAHDQGILRRVTGWNDKRLADLAVSSGKERAAARLGVTPDDLALAQLRKRT
ncbi:MAG TPA: hypothetical protein DIS96_03785 [Pusillimonas sp.]|nr:hypothetical protein [Pusillimonas sp.]